MDKANFYPTPGARKRKWHKKQYPPQPDEGTFTMHLPGGVVLPFHSIEDANRFFEQRKRLLNGKRK